MKRDRVATILGIALVLGGASLSSPLLAENHVVQVVNNAFNPSQLTIQTGDTVTFEKGSTPGMPHNVISDAFIHDNGCTFGPTCFECGAGNGCFGSGASGEATTSAFSITLSFFNQAGTFPYFCETHGAPNGVGMAGRIIVQQTAPPPPPPPPPPTTDAGAIRFTNAGYSRAENVGNAAIQVERTSGDDGAVGVSFSTSNGSAAAGQDYTAAAGTLNWADGEDGVKTFNVAVANDGNDESNETINLHLTSPTGGAVLGNLSNATMTIVDDDGATSTGTVQFTSTTFSIAEALPQATVSVSRTGSSQGAASVDYDTSNGTATAGQDYTAVGGTLNWANGDAADKSFNIPILDDLNSEAAETLSIALSQPSGATLGSPAAATLTLFDNENVPPCVDGEFQVCLLGRFLAMIHWVRPNNQGQGEGRVTKLTDSAASFEFFEPGNVEVVLKMKDACGLPQNSPLRNFWAFVAGLTNVRVELTIIDTESGARRRFFNGLGQPFFTPAADSPDGKANPPGAILATTEALGAFPTCDVATATATAGQDDTAVGGTLNRANGDAADKSFNIPILDDLNSEAAETLSIALSQPSGATLGSPADATLTTFDNVSAPCVDGEFQVCLLGRFLANIHWVRPNNQGQGEGRVTKLTDSAASFEFFEPGNVEVVLKMKDACGLPQNSPLRNFWAFVAGLTNVRVELTIIDTESGARRRFFNGLGQPFFTPAADSPDGKANPPGAILATTEALGAFPTCDV